MRKLLAVGGTVVLEAVVVGAVVVGGAVVGAVVAVVVLSVLSLHSSPTTIGQQTIKHSEVQCIPCNTHHHKAF